MTDQTEPRETTTLASCAPSAVATNEAEEHLRYPNATRRRLAIARTLGVIGILATVGLAVAALASYLSRSTTQALTASSGRRDATDAAPSPAAVQPLVNVQRIPTTEPPPALAAAPPASSAPAPPLPDAMLEASAAPTPAPEPPVAARPSEPVRAASSSRHSRSETQLTSREIERRQQRYEMWLRREGLERIH